MNPDWLVVLNNTYNVQLDSLEELRTQFTTLCSPVVHFVNKEGASWARYHPQEKTLTGKNGHVIAHSSAEDALWWGEAFSHQNQKNPDVSKGEWQCHHGVLKNRYGSTIYVHGIVPKCLIVPFLEWQPGAARYGRLACDYERMMEMFRFDFGIEDEDE